ncbi:hypothetical protein RZN25_10215 [Bacillaceae bacterium S4-13-56]
MKRFVAIGFTISVTIYAILHFVTYLFPSPIGLYALATSGVAAIIFALLFLSMRAALIPLFLLAVATVIEMTTGGSIIEFVVYGMLEMRSLIALLLIVPIIGWILREEPYIDAIMDFAKSILNTGNRFHFGIMLVNQIIAYFLLFGAIPVMYQFVNDFLKGKKGEAWEYFKGTALLRSFALTTLWVISIPSFAFAVDHLKAPLGWTIAQGFIISIGGMILSVLFLIKKEKKYQIVYTEGIQDELERLAENSMDPHKRNRLVFEFAFLFVSLFSVIFILHISLGWELLIIIPPIIVIWTMGYFLLKRRMASFWSEGKVYFTKEVRLKSQQFGILLAAGALIFSVNQSGIGDQIVNGLFYVEKVVPFVNFLMILPFVAIFLGFLGLGPLTVIVLVAGILQGVSLPYPPELVVLSMTSGSVISVVLSPMVIPIIILSATNGLGVIKNGFSFNLSYSIAFYLLVQIYIQTMLVL